jgi:uncharacterized protein YndB with AHSA1/START domain
MQQVTREVVIEAPPATVWWHIIDPATRRSWFGGDLELGDLTPGSEGSYLAPGARRAVRVEDVEDGRSLTYTWQDGDHASQVHIELEPAAGGSLVRVTESTDLPQADTPHTMLLQAA